jgi:tRNA1Val (adenine37-N6)-methyltransferase
LTADATPPLSPPAQARPPRRPAGWRAPGPPPRGADGDPTLAPARDETLSYLSGDWRIFQKRDGHRWSLDDLATAWFAVTVTGPWLAPSGPRTHLDLGCGIGSVLQLVAWTYPAVRSVGVEAQEVSAKLAGRSLRYNGCDDRVRVLLGDLRDIDLGGARFDLVTGTPPYLPLGSGTVSTRIQRGPCCFEVRGGVEEYTAAAARHLAPDGWFVMCAGSPQTARVAAGAAAAGLTIARFRRVIPREGRAPLFDLYAMVPAPTGRAAASAALAEAPLVIRDALGGPTPAYLALRRAMGMPAPG